jgi:hypothetical protein
MVGNPEDIKEKIIALIKTRGPSIPINLSKDLGMDTLFTSAFLGELASEKRLKSSCMKIGGSSIYFLPEQIEKMEHFGEKYLSGKEKDAFHLLKEKKILQHEEQEPSIRVALASLRDFAFPEKHENKIYWRYFNHKEKIPEEKILKEEIPQKKNPEEIKNPQEELIKKQENTKEELQEKRIENIFSEKQQEVKEENVQKKETSKSKTSKKKTKTSVSTKATEKFFNQIKEHLNKKSIEITDILSFSKTDLSLKVIDSGQEKILIGYNKKRPSETDIIKAYRKSQELNLPYLILAKGEPSKKLQESIKAAKKLSRIETLE